MFHEPANGEASASAEPTDATDSMAWLEKTLAAEDERATRDAMRPPRRASYAPREVAAEGQPDPQEPAPGAPPEPPVARVLAPVSPRPPPLAARVVESELAAPVVRRRKKPAVRAAASPPATPEYAEAPQYAAPRPAPPPRRALAPRHWTPPPLGEPPPPRELVPVPRIDPDGPPRLQGHFDHRHLMPASNGATGLVDMPVAAVTPRNELLLTYQFDHFAADKTWWPAAYRSVQADTHLLNASYGMAGRVELNAQVELWDRDLEYTDPVAGTRPHFSTEGKAFVGIGGKMVTPNGWFFGLPFALGAGFHVAARRDGDRNVTELHEYERLNHLYAVVSMRPADDLYLHAMLKWVVYDFDGDRSPSGRAGAFPGLFVKTDWLQPGFGAEWFFFPDCSLYGELVHDASIDFPGLKQLSLNAGARYQARRWGASVFARRLDHEGVETYGFQAMLRLP